MVALLGWVWFCEDHDCDDLAATSWLPAASRRSVLPGDSQPLQVTDATLTFRMEGGKCMRGTPGEEFDYTQAGGCAIGPIALARQVL